MVVIAGELLQYDKNNINYFINYPKLYLERDKDLQKQVMIEKINKKIFEDISIFMELNEDIKQTRNQDEILMNSLTEFRETFNFHNVMSLIIEYSQIEDIFDISHMKSYNYDLDLKRKILLQDLFKEGIDFQQILKKQIEEQLKKITKELHLNTNEDLYPIVLDNICIDNESVFYFTEDYLVLPFSSFEIDIEITNLVEFIVPFNIIYPYMSKYAIKKIVHKVIL